jgi:hypothetical protein
VHILTGAAAASDAGTSPGGGVVHARP